MGKFKIGDRVTTSSSIKKSRYDGQAGIIENVTDCGENYKVHGGWWIESALTLVEDKKEVKPEEVVYVLQQDWVDPYGIVSKGTEASLNGFHYYFSNKLTDYHKCIYQGDEILKDESWFKVKEQRKMYVIKVKEYKSGFGFSIKRNSDSYSIYLEILIENLAEILIAEREGRLEIKK